VAISEFLGSDERFGPFIFHRAVTGVAAPRFIANVQIAGICWRGFNRHLIRSAIAGALSNSLVMNRPSSTSEVDIPRMGCEHDKMVSGTVPADSKPLHVAGSADRTRPVPWTRFIAVEIYQKAQGCGNLQKQPIRMAYKPDSHIKENAARVIGRTARSPLFDVSLPLR
jgi:hypothetical protein